MSRLSNNVPSQAFPAPGKVARDCAQSPDDFWSGVRGDIRRFIDGSNFNQATFARALKIGAGKVNKLLRGLGVLTRSEIARLERFFAAQSPCTALNPGEHGELIQIFDATFPRKPRKYSLRGARTFTLTEYARLAPTEVRS